MPTSCCLSLRETYFYLSGVMSWSTSMDASGKRRKAHAACQHPGYSTSLQAEPVAHPLLNRLLFKPVSNSILQFAASASVTQ